jgi:hypothetical protein
MGPFSKIRVALFESTLPPDGDARTGRGRRAADRSVRLPYTSTPRLGWPEAKAKPPTLARFSEDFVKVFRITVSNLSLDLLLTIALG